MGLFGDLDIASANENPFFKPDGTYRCEIAKVEVRKAKSGNMGMDLQYLIVEDEPNNKKGKKITEWLNVPTPSQLESDDPEVKEKAERFMSFLKRRLKDFGVPLEEMNSVDGTYLLNKVPQLDITIKNADGNERITGVKIAEGDVERDPFA